MYENIKLHMTEKYNQLAFTDKYIFGFFFADMVYMTFKEANEIDNILTIDKASRGQGMALRFKPNKWQKAILIQNAQPICSKVLFEGLVSDSKYNRGEIFEKLVTEKYGQKWEKDNIPFTLAGDIEIDGIAYQIKFEKATFCNEKSLLNLEKQVDKL